MWLLCLLCRQAVDQQILGQWIRIEIKSVLEMCTKDLHRMKKIKTADEVNRATANIEKVERGMFTIRTDVRICHFQRLLIIIFMNVSGSEGFHGCEKNKF